MLRYGSLFASSFLSGLAKAEMTPASSVILPMGGSVPIAQKLDAKDKMTMAIGNVGTQYADHMSENFNKAPTIKVASGSPIGVLLMSDMTIPSAMLPVYDTYKKNEELTNEQ